MKFTLETKGENKERFNRIMEFAKAVILNAEKSQQYNGKNLSFETHPIIDVIRLLGRKLQTEYMVDALYREDESVLYKLTPSDVFFDIREPLTSDGKVLRDLKREVNSDRRVHLGRDLILPCPWKRYRYIDAFVSIGNGRRNGSWEQDFNNHYVEVWLPIGIAWVHGGNHSIASGIVQGVGELKPESIFDISDVYDYVYTDGETYRSKLDGRFISSVNHIEFAAIFEIGRMMKERSICW